MQQNNCRIGKKLQEFEVFEPQILKSYFKISNGFQRLTSAVTTWINVGVKTMYKSADGLLAGFCKIHQCLQTFEVNSTIASYQSELKEMKELAVECSTKIQYLYPLVTVPTNPDATESFTARGALFSQRFMPQHVTHCVMGKLL